MEVTREDVLRCAQLTHLSLAPEEIEPLRLGGRELGVVGGGLSDFECLVVK